MRRFFWVAVVAAFVLGFSASDVLAARFEGTSIGTLRVRTLDPLNDEDITVTGALTVEGAVVVSNAVDVTGVLSGSIGLSLDTAASVTLTADNVDATGMKGQIHINDDADVITYALPGAAAGLVFYIANSDVGGANVITIDPVAGDKFVHEGLLMADDENLVSNGAGSACMIVGLDATRWLVIELNGDFNEATP